MKVTEKRLRDTTCQEKAKRKKNVKHEFLMMHLNYLQQAHQARFQAISSLSLQGAGLTNESVKINQ